jgi:hypothetical protein
VFQVSFGPSGIERVAVIPSTVKLQRNTIDLSDINYEGRLHYDKTFGDFSINAFAVLTV